MTDTILHHHSEILFLTPYVFYHCRTGCQPTTSDLSPLHGLGQDRTRAYLVAQCLNPPPRVIALLSASQADKATMFLP